MDTIIQISFYTSLICGTLLALFMLLSLLGGLDLDFEINTVETDVGTGGLGVLKSGLAFLTFTSWVANILLSASVNPLLTLFVSVAVGVLVVFLMTYFLKFLLGLQSNVNWDFHQAEGKSGKVYLKIPEKGTGLIQIDINGVTRELKAKSNDNSVIPSGSEILVLEVEKEIAEVTLYK